jgi:hypothetical protein
MSACFYEMDSIAVLILYGGGHVTFLLSMSILNARERAPFRRTDLSFSHDTRDTRLASKALPETFKVLKAIGVDAWSSGLCWLTKW